MYCQVINLHKSKFGFFQNLKFPLFRHNKKMGPNTSLTRVKFGTKILFDQYIAKLMKCI